MWGANWFADEIWPSALWVFTTFWPALAIGIGVVLFMNLVGFVLDMLRMLREGGLGGPRDTDVYGNRQSYYDKRGRR